MQKNEFGIEPELYRLAKYYVQDIGFDYYPEIEEGPTKEKMNVTKMSEIINWCCYNLGLIDDNGFTIPLKVKKQLLGSSSVFEAEEFEGE